ncbi:MAG: ComF family protein, partial [Alphaproteobacteria bacterium]|nr:ComF family protein [Alphaproteobacteria bacterium]
MSHIQSFFNFLYPPECIGCSVPVAVAHSLCGDCFSKLSFIKGTLCECCGYPLEDDDAHRCVPCITKPPPYILRSTLKYNDLSKELILKLKYFDRMDLSNPLGGFLYQAAQPYLHDIDYFIPVPLYWQRLWHRRYNQATELSHHLSSRVKELTSRDIPVMHQNLIRTKNTESQRMKSSLHRLRNMQGAFIVRDPASLKDKRVAIIDDVYTSGATLRACVRSLQKADVKEIYAFTVARVVRGEVMLSK